MRLGVTPPVGAGVTPTIRPIEGSATVDVEAESSLAGTLITLGGAYGLYVLGLQSNAITTIGALAAIGSIAFKALEKK